MKAVKVLLAVIIVLVCGAFAQPVHAQETLVFIGGAARVGAGSIYMYWISSDTPDPVVDWKVSIQYCPGNETTYIKKDAAPGFPLDIQVTETACSKIVVIASVTTFDGVFSTSRTIEVVPNVFDFRVKGPNTVKYGQLAQFTIIRNMRCDYYDSHVDENTHVELIDKQRDEVKTYHGTSFIVDLPGTWGMRWHAYCGVDNFDGTYTVYGREKVIGQLHIKPVK